MDAFLSTTFMKRHSNQDTKLGHANEGIIMENAIRDIKFSISATTKINFACEVGLVSSLENDYLHASPDYLLVIKKKTTEA